MAWKPTPLDRMLPCKKLQEDGQWVDCEIEDLKMGDIFKIIFSVDLDIIADCRGIIGMVANDLMIPCIATRDAQRAPEVGWCIPCEDLVSLAKH